MCATFIGSTFVHSPLPGRAEVGDPRWHGDPGPGEGDGPSGAPDQLRESFGRPVDHVRWPSVALRAAAETLRVSALLLALPIRASACRGRPRCPPCASSEERRSAKPSFSASMPSSRSPLPETCLTARPRPAPGPRACGPRRAPCRRARGRGPRGWRARRPRASPAEIASPIRFISRAFSAPTSRGRRWVPPKPGMIPSLISGWPKTADSAAIRKSQAIASSQPPPKASALTAAIVGDRLRAELAQQRVPVVDQLLAAGLVHLRERLDVGAGREHDRDRRGDHHGADRRPRLEASPRPCPGPRSPAARSRSSAGSRARRSRCRRGVSSLTVSVWSPSSGCG